jgi:hypothetical protein
MRRLTQRRQSVVVMTVNTLRSHLESISGPACRFTIHKVQRDRISVRADYILEGKKKHAEVQLPAYPTGSTDDVACNNLNVVLDPIDFTDVDGCAERDVFEPLIGAETLAHYEKTHPDATLPITRCC